MNKLFKNKAFVSGFFVGLVAFYLTNYCSYLQNRPGNFCDDCGWSFGVPFRLYQEVGFFSVKEFLWFGLTADILIAITFSFIVGLILKFVWEKLTAKRLK